MTRLPAISLNSSKEVKISRNPSFPLENRLSLTIEDLESDMTYYLAYPVGDKETDLVTNYEQVDFYITDDEDESEALANHEFEESECSGLDPCVSKTEGYLVKSDGKNIKCTLDNIEVVKEGKTKLYLFSVNKQEEYTLLCEEEVEKKKADTKIRVAEPDIFVPHNPKFPQAGELSFTIENLEVGVKYYLAYLVGSDKKNLVNMKGGVTCKITTGGRDIDKLEKKDHKYDFKKLRYPSWTFPQINETKGWLIQKSRATGNDIEGTLGNIHIENEGKTWLYLFSVDEQNYTYLDRWRLDITVRKLSTKVSVTGGIPIEVSQKDADRKSNTLSFTIEDLEIGVEYYLAYPVGDKATDLVTEIDAKEVSYAITSGDFADRVETKKHEHTFEKSERSDLPIVVSSTRGLTLQKKSKEGANSISGTFDNIYTRNPGQTVLYLFLRYAKDKYRKLNQGSFKKELISLEITTAKASPAVIESGQETTISWKCKGPVRSYRLLPFDEDKDAATEIVYNRKVKLVDSTEIYVEVNNFVRRADIKQADEKRQQLSEQKKVEISVKKSKIKEFKFSCDGKDVPEGHVIKPGKTVVLSWDVTCLGTRIISISSSVKDKPFVTDEPLKAKGTVILTPKDDITYTLSVSNKDKKGTVVAEEKRKIIIDELKIIDFSAEPQKVKRDRPDIKFSWKLKNAEVATISPTYMTSFDDLESIRIEKEDASISVSLDPCHMIDNQKSISYTLTAARTNSEGIWETTEKHLRLKISP